MSRKTKTPEADKSQQLAAAAVGAGTEQLQAQPKPKEEGAVLVDPDAEAARLAAEAQVAEEARLAAEASAAKAASLAAESQGGDASSANVIGAPTGPGANLAAEGQDGDVVRGVVDEALGEPHPGVQIGGFDESHAEAFSAAAQLDPDLIAQVRDQVSSNLQRKPATAAQPDWLLGQFDVKAKSPAGFWRCGIQFLHSTPTRVFAVTAKADVPHDHDCEIPCCYLTQEEAKRVYGDPWLKVLVDSTVIKD